VNGEPIYDMVGVGFGPANLALAAAAEELPDAPPGRQLRRVFLERRPEPGWHPGMLIENSLIQISVLKDLATIRDPRSRFTFLNYLKEKGRLFEFLNLRDLFPTRIEFNDYLVWVAEQLRHRVRFGQEVVAVTPVPAAPAVRRQPVELLSVVARDLASGRTASYLTANLVVATGGVPAVPAGIELRPGGRTFHSEHSLPRLHDDFPDAAARYRFLVVGAGQSGAELFHYLVSHYRNAEVTAAIRRLAYKPVDDTDFTNEIFFPQMVDLLYGLPEEKRRMVLGDCRDVNYAVVDAPLIRRIYKLLYGEKVMGRERARILPYLHLERVREAGDGVIAQFQDRLRDREVVLEADALILCTGYVWPGEHPLLAGIAPWIERDAAGKAAMTRDYRLAGAPGFAPGVYVQGFAEQTHGPSETVLSLLPVRASEILASVLASRDARAGSRFAAAASARTTSSRPGAASRGLPWTGEPDEHGGSRAMFLQKLDPNKLHDAYGIQIQMLYPWEGVVQPPFGAAWAVVAPGGSTKHHGHQEGETFFVVKGRGEMRIGDDTVPVAAGDVVYQPPFQRHTLHNTAADEDLIFLAIWWEDLNLWTGHGRDPGPDRALPRRVLVTSAPPTPNGDLHLGHLSGPYLAGDVAARYLKLRGAEVHYVFGSDDNQSYVATHAASLGLEPQQAADRLAADIEATLRAACIEVEQFVRPNTSPWHVATVQELFRALHAGGKLEARTALAPYCESCRRYLYDAYLNGRCPHCGAPWGCNCCEECGRHVDCVELLEPVCARCGRPAARRPLERLYFPLSRYAAELRGYHERVAMNPNLRALCEQALEAGLPDVAVTAPADWGIAVPVPGFGDQRIFVWCEMAARYLAYARHLGVGWEAYFKADEAEVVQCFGFDNGFYYALLLPALLRAYDPAIRLAQALVMNEFYRLDGRKFSTTRQHAIMGRELLADVPADLVRFYLAATRPEVEGTNFTLADFAETTDRELLGHWQPWLEELAARAQQEARGIVPATGDWTAEHRLFYDRLEGYVAEAASAYDARSFSPQRAVRVMGELVREARRFGKAEESWRRVAARGEERRTALALELLAAKALAQLAAPILPDFAARLWGDLGIATPLGTHCWEDRPYWLPEGQKLGALAATRYFPSAREAVGKRKQQAA
jgi:methionyl-tRNA synthetase